MDHDVKRMFAPALLVLAVALTNACATVQTMDGMTTRDSPKVMSGTRLDVTAIQGNRAALQKFDAEPPEYPWLDLPFSMVADVVLLPVTLSAAAYDVLMY